MFASYLIRVVAKEDRLLPHFLNYFLNSPATQSALKMLATRGVSQSNINATKLKGIKVLLPPIKVQRTAVESLLGVEAKIQAEQSRQRALNTLFNTLLHHLMTGKVRVHDLDFAAAEEVTR